MKQATTAAKMKAYAVAIESLFSYYVTTEEDRSARLALITTLRDEMNALERRNEPRALAA